MIFQLEFRFWLCALAIFVLVRLRPPVPPSTWFALLNLAAVYLLLGLQATVLISGFSALLWLCLFMARKLNGRATSTVLVFVATIGIGLGVIWQKMLFEFVQAGATVPLPLPWSLRLLALISFSYVALRAWDAVAAVRDGAPLLDPIALSGYLAPFFMMPAGPVNVYREHIEVDTRGGFPAPD